jgi:hypothetical protein
VRRGLLLGELDRDLACAIALGFVEAPHVRADLEVIWILDVTGRPLASQSPWLDTTDPLDVATREYLTSRRALGKDFPNRPETSRKVFDARQRVRELIAERGVLRKARAAGYVVAGETPAAALPPAGNLAHAY